MRNSLVLAAAVLALLAAPVLAGDGHVSKSALNSLGLGQMAVQSDAFGMQVRGRDSNAYSTAFSSFALVWYDPATASQFNANGSQFNRATSTNAGPSIVSLASGTSTAGSPTGIVWTTAFPNALPSFAGAVTPFSISTIGTTMAF